MKYNYLSRIKNLSLRFFIFSFLILISTNTIAKNSCNFPFELSTKDSQIIDQCGKPFKLKSVNWYGAHDVYEVPGGLDKQPLAHIVQLIKDGGFNSVRLTFSNQMLHHNEAVDPKTVAANPELVSKTPLQVFDIVIKSLTDAGIVVILNDHTTLSAWCCGFDYNGLWHHPDYQSTTDWINDWLMLVNRYKDNPWVAGVDLRNEVRTSRYYRTIFPVFPNWGNGDENDWKMAATDAANAIQNINPKLLIIIEGINWYGVPLIDGYRPMLIPVKDNPIVLNHPHKLVYEEHVYSYTGPKHSGDDQVSIGQVHYRDMDEATLQSTLNDEFGYVLEPGHVYTAPVWLGEFGIEYQDPSDSDKIWFQHMVNYLLEKNMGWGYWALNPARADGTEDTYGLLTDDWSQYRKDWRYEWMQRLIRG